IRTSQAARTTAPGGCRHEFPGTFEPKGGRNQEVDRQRVEPRNGGVQPGSGGVRCRPDQCRSEGTASESTRKEKYGDGQGYGRYCEGFRRKDESGGRASPAACGQRR